MPNQALRHLGSTRSVWGESPGGWADFLSVRASTWNTAAIAFPLAALIVAILLWSSAGVLTYQDDAAQYISTAQHIMDGHGALTSVLYYDSQLTQAAPAVQTVWPAGFPAITALVAQVTGLEVSRALLLVVITAHIATAMLLAAALHMAGVGAWLVFSVACFWLLNVTSWLSVSRGLSDPLYQMFAIGIAVAIAGYFRRGQSRPDLGNGRPTRVQGGGHWLVLAIILAMGALMVRYQAIALIAPLALATTVGRFQSESLRRRLLKGLLVAAPAAILVALLFARNYALTGALTGGAVSARGQTLSEVAQRIAWAPQSAQFLALTLLILSCLICAVAAFVIWVRDTAESRIQAVHCPPVTRALLVYCLGAYAANIGLLLYLCLSSTAYAIELRYLGVCLMFLVLPVFWLASSLWQQSPYPAGGTLPSFFNRRLEPVLTGLVAIATVAQLVILQTPYLDRLSEAPPARLHRILSSHQTGGMSALALLRGAGGDAKAMPVLMSTHAHALSLLTSTTVIGVPVPVYTGNRWDAAQIHALADRHNVKYVVAFRRMETWVYRDLINKMIDEHQCLEWLEPLVATRELVIARVVDQSEAKTCKLPVPPPEKYLDVKALVGSKTS